MNTKVIREAQERTARDIISITGVDYEKKIIREVNSIMAQRGWQLVSEEPEVVSMNGGQVEYIVRTYVTLNGRKRPKNEYFEEFRRVAQTIVSGLLSGKVEKKRNVIKVVVVEK